MNDNNNPPVALHILGHDWLLEPGDVEGLHLAGQLHRRSWDRGDIMSGYYQ